tara:strand:+ start:1025 stop:1264 length:240 start_codon:yes stop_codon:yes gene_type:complete
MNKDKICKILGDMTAFVSLQLLAAHGFNEDKAKPDKIVFSVMMMRLSKELKLTKEEVVGVTTYAQNYINRRIDGKEEEE